MKNFSYLRIFPVSIVTMAVLLGLKICMIADYFFAADPVAPPSASTIVASALADATVSPAATEAKPAVSDTTAKDACSGGASCHPPGDAPPTAAEKERAALLEKLSQRQSELDALKDQLSEREKLVAASEMVLHDKMTLLDKTEQSYQSIGAQHQKLSDSDLDRLVRIYENMNPRDAAPIFNVLDMQILVAVIDHMNPRKASAIMAGMSPQRVNLTTQNLANFHKDTVNSNAVKSD